MVKNTVCTPHCRTDCQCSEQGRRADTIVKAVTAVAVARGFPKNLLPSAYIHADGAEEFRPRTPEEIAAIEEANRIAAQSNVRSGSDRRKNPPDSFCMAIGMGRKDRRSGSDRRAVLSTFERDMLMKVES